MSTCSEEYIRNCIEYKNGIVEDGDSTYIETLFRNVLSGKSITVGFLGGSITQDSVTTKHEYGYAYRVYDWFKNTFSNVEVKYVNAGIGATDSEFAAARVREHLLSFAPDFILMEHAVNDECTPHYMETYEGVVRQILNSNPTQALLLMCNVFYNDGSSAELMHRRIARHYDLPVVSMRPTIYQALLEGKFDNRYITADDLHPNDLGHELVAKVITTYLDTVLSKVKKDLQELSSKEADDKNAGIVLERKLPAPFTANRYEKSIKLDNRNTVMIDGELLDDMKGPAYLDDEEVVAMEGNKAPSIHNPGIAVKLTGRIPAISDSDGFISDKSKQTLVRDCFLHGYIGTKKGSFIQYEVTGSCISVQYKRTIKLPAPIAKCVIDGDEENAIILDANFDETWGDKLVLTPVYENLEEWEESSEKGIAKKHTVRIEIIEDHPNDIGEFYLAGIIVSAIMA